MTDDLKAPERIWAWQEFAQGFPQGAGGWITHQTGGRTEYVRADRIANLEAALAALSRIEAQAEARGMRKAEQMIRPQLAPTGNGVVVANLHCSADRILALADATEAAAKGGV